MTNGSDHSRNRVLDLARSARVAWRLFFDRRVPIWTKAIPILSLAYVVWPLDFLADPTLGLGQLDDIAVILIGLKLFISLCSADLVRQHEQDLQHHKTNEETVDTTYRVLNKER